jgi:hypothetical protein
LRRARTTGAFASATGAVAAAIEGATSPAGADVSKAGSALPGWTTTGVSVIGAAFGSTEKAGDFAEREERRLDFFGALTSATSGVVATWGEVSAGTSIGSVEGTA